MSNFNDNKINLTNMNIILYFLKVLNFNLYQTFRKKEIQEFQKRQR